MPGSGKAIFIEESWTLTAFPTRGHEDVAWPGLHWHRELKDLEHPYVFPVKGLANLFRFFPNHEITELRRKK
jgi:hypothetical protein